MLPICNHWGVVSPRRRSEGGIPPVANIVNCPNWNLFSMQPSWDRTCFSKDAHGSHSVAKQHQAIV